MRRYAPPSFNPAPYTFSVTRTLRILATVLGFFLITWTLAGSASSQTLPTADATIAEPPEEDTTGERKVEYAFNPLQSQKEIKIGKYYFKKGSYKAALRRFEEALKWDPNSGEALLGLGEVHTKLGDKKAAREVYTRFLEVNPDSKEAAAIRKKLESKD